MAMLLNQQDMQLHTFPRPMFKVVNFTMSGYSCMPDKVPVDRALTYPVASNLYRDAEELLRNLHLAPFSKPLVSLIDDFPVQQKHKGWQFGYLTSNTSSQVCGCEVTGSSITAADSFPHHCMVLEPRACIECLPKA